MGRIPVYNAAYSTLDNILQKIIDYETEANPLSWRRQALLPMSYSDAGYDGAMLAEQMQDDYLDANSFTSWTMYQQGTGICPVDDSTYASSETLHGDTVVRDRWAAQDFGLMVWWGHGSQTQTIIGYGSCVDGNLFLNTQVTSLDDDHPSFTYQCSCTNGYPENTANLQYSLLKQGGVATVSASRVSWFTTSEVYGQFDGSTSNAGIGYEYSKRLIQTQPAGQALYNTKASMTPSMNTRLMNYYDFNLYGDPATLLLPLQPPSPLTATPISSTRIDLGWADPNTLESGFQVERSLNGSTGWVQIATPGANATSYSDTGLTCGVPQYYRVRAYNSYGASLYSNVATATPPCGPGAFTKTSPGDGATGVSENPTLSWSASSGATSYFYCYDMSDDDNCTGWTDNGVQTSAALSGLLPGTWYYWQVYAHNDTGDTYADGSNTSYFSFRTAGGYSSYLPLMMKPAAPTSPLVNGNFESGPGVGWSEYSLNGYELIEELGDYGMTPHSGQWGGSLAGDENETSELWQSVTIPPASPNLHFWHWVYSGDSCGHDFAYLEINDGISWAFDLCNDTGNWVEVIVDLSIFSGMTVKLEFRAVTNGSLTSYWFLDDVSLQP